MTIRNFEYLLRPKSVALVGASTRAGSVGLITARNLLGGGFSGPVWFVNPKYRTIEGHDCHASVAALPAAPDLAILVTPPATIPQLIEDLGAKGTRAAIVITAGVRGELKQAMLDAARPHLLRIQGPNCVGLMLPRIGLNASFSYQPLAGDLAFVSQSGALITGIIDWARGRNIGFSHVVSLGDMADADFGDLLDYLAADTHSRAILLYMEAVTNAPKFMSAARRAARSKPVIVVKAGRSATGAKAALSHTGALAGADSAYDAAFRRAGLLRVRDLDDLFNAAEMLSRTARLEGERLMILTNGGGAGVLATDALIARKGRLAALTDATITALDRHLPATWSHANPVDIIGDADAERYAATLEVVLAAPEVDAVLVLNCPTAIVLSEGPARATIKAASQQRKPVIAGWLGGAAAEPARRLFSEAGVPSLETPARAVRAFMHLIDYARAQTALGATPPSLPSEFTPDTARVRRLIDQILTDGREMAIPVPVLPPRRSPTRHPAPTVSVTSATTANVIATIATTSSVRLKLGLTRGTVSGTRPRSRPRGPGRRCRSGTAPSGLQQAGRSWSAPARRRRRSRGPQ